MNKVMRWGACALMLCFAVALGPVFGQQAFADTTLNASDVEYADLVLEGDTVLNLDANIELTSIVSEDKLTIKGDGALTVNNKGGKAIEVKSLKIADGLEIAVPEDGKAKDGTIVDADGDAASKVKIKAKAVKQAALETEADEDEGEGDGAGGAGGLATQADSYIVTFNVQGHGTAPEDQTVEEGQTADDPATPTA